MAGVSAWSDPRAFISEIAGTATTARATTASLLRVRSIFFSCSLALSDAECRPARFAMGMGKGYQRAVKSPLPAGYRWVTAETWYFGCAGRAGTRLRRANRIIAIGSAQFPIGALWEQ